MAEIRYDGADAGSIARRCGVPRVDLHDTVASTLDVAHGLAAAGALPGTLVLADRQTAGRGRAGRSWTSARGAGIWMTIIERPVDSAATGVLALRIGLALAPALDSFAGAPVRLKWPNDLWVHERKLAGVLVEARWRQGAIEWVAIGIGINVRAPEGIDTATGLVSGTGRVDVLGAVVPAVRAALELRGELTAGELAAFAVRDLAVGRLIVEPAIGTVLGVAADGALEVQTAAGVSECRVGSLVFAPDAL